MSTLRLLFFFLLIAWCCPASDADQALVGALRWYYRWIAELPVTAGSPDCKVAVFTNSQFAYCEPGKLSIDIETPQGSPAAVTNITRAFTGFPEELRDFVNHRYAGPQQIPSVRTMSVSRSDLAECKVDVEQTRQLAGKAVGSRQREDLLNRGIALRFPLACDGDPFYLIYFMRGGDVEWIWQIRPGMGPVWSYDKHGDQREIPSLAIRNLARPEMWYRAQ
jgi:hypothetical protein